MIDMSVGATFRAAAFILHHNIVNENGIPITFKQHKFLIEPYQDESRSLVVTKCSQIGFSTLAIIRSFHLAKYKKANIIYTLPSKAIVKDFVSPKVQPLIESNKAIKDMMGETDNLGLKSVGDRFLYFRSSWDPASGIAISAHILINDEVDRSNQVSLSTYRTRLDAALLDRSDLGWHWKFSNPTLEGYGVDEEYQKSDHKEWFTKCERCNYQQILSFPDNINFKTEEFICTRCHRVITNENRRHGQWVQKYLNRKASGYHISQLMAPWVSAGKIISDSKGDQSIFYNFTLGLAYTSKDIKITREAITKCIYPTVNPMVDVAIGVDNGIIKHYVCMNRYGIFKIGETKDWEEIEQLRNQYDAHMVIDSNPYPTPANKLAKKYPGKVFVHFYDEDSRETDIIRFLDGDKKGTVRSDRTKIIDSAVADINATDILINLSLTELENAGFIQHCLNMYRIVEENAKGIKRGVWKTIGQDYGSKKPDHYLHALIYATIAMKKTLVASGVLTTPPSPGQQQKQQKAMYIDPLTQQANDGFDLNKLREQLNKPKSKPFHLR